MKRCKYCNAEMNDNETTCRYCGSVQPADSTTPPPFSDNNTGNATYGNANNSYAFNAQDYYQRNNAFDSGPTGKSRGIAALLALILGGLGIQYFYLGKNTAGLLSIVLSLFTCGLWQTVAFIQGIMMLCMSNADFNKKYVENPSNFPVF